MSVYSLLYLVFWGPRRFQFDLEMNNNIYCMHFIIRVDYWWPLRAAIIFFQKKSGQTNTQTQVRTENLVFWGPRSFQFDLEMNIDIYSMHYIIREDYWRP